MNEHENEHYLHYNLARQNYNVHILYLILYYIFYIISNTIFYNIYYKYYI